MDGAKFWAVDCVCHLQLERAVHPVWGGRVCCSPVVVCPRALDWRTLACSIDRQNGLAYAFAPRDPSDYFALGWVLGWESYPPCVLWWWLRVPWLGSGMSRRHRFFPTSRISPFVAARFPLAICAPGMECAGISRAHCRVGSVPTAWWFRGLHGFVPLDVPGDPLLVPRLQGLEVVPYAHLDCSGGLAVAGLWGVDPGRSACPVDVLWMRCGWVL